MDNLNQILFRQSHRSIQSMQTQPNQTMSSQNHSNRDSLQQKPPFSNPAHVLSDYNYEYGDFANEKLQIDQNELIQSIF